MDVEGLMERLTPYLDAFNTQDILIVYTLWIICILVWWLSEVKY